MAIQLEVKKTYNNRRGDLVTIEKYIDQPGIIPHYIDVAGQHYLPEGRFVMGTFVCHDLDIVSEYNPTLIERTYNVPREGDIDVGQVVGDFHGHVPTTGVFKDWKLDQPCEITAEMFYGILAKLDTKGELIQNKMARVMAEPTIDVEGNVSMVIVVYRYDQTYWMAPVFRPDWFTKLAS